MKRVLIVIHNLDLGGMEICVMNYLRHFDREKLIFDFCVHGEKGYFEDEAIALGAKIFRAPTRKQRFFKNILTMKKIYKNYDFIIVCTEHSFGFIELFTAWTSGVKTRAAWSMFSDYQGRSRLKRQAHFITRPLLRLFSNMKFACSIPAGQWLFKKNFDMINNAIDLNKFAFSAEARKKIREKHGFENEFVIGIAGRLSAVKNHVFALDVFNEICKTEENTALLIIGDGELRQELEKNVSQLGILNKVIFAGKVEKISAYYQAMDLLLIPSFHEGLPTVAVEAQAAGLTVLLSDTITREVKICENAHFLTLETGAEAWAKKISGLKKRERTAVDLTESGYDIAREAERFQNILLK